MDTKEAGRRGGVQRAKNLTPERRIEIARIAGEKGRAVRWAKRRRYLRAQARKGAV
jgi:general stress protein YciG